MSNFQYRIIQYNTTTGAKIGPGPRASSLDASAPLNDIPALTATFDDPQSIVRAPAEVAIELSTDNGQTWTEPPNMRFAIIADDEDEIRSPDKPKPSAVGMFWLLKKAVVHVESGPLDADGRRSWSTITPGTLIRTLIQEAQARGVLGWLDMSTFSSTVDSNGTTWPSTFSTSHEIGVSYDTIIQTLADVGLIDFQMVGRSLRVYVPDTYLAPTTANVVLVEGKDYTEATKKTTYELVASRNLVKGDGVSTVVVDAAADKPWGEWEVTTSASGSSDLADLNLLADVGYARSSVRQTQRTFTVYPNNASSPKPWIDYKVGDKIRSVTKKTVEIDLRVRQMTLRASKSSCLVTLILGDRLLERDIRMQRMLKAASGGVAGAGSNGTFPSSGTEDTVEPSPPTSIGFSSTAVLINGAIIADLTISWTAPTTNQNGTILDDLDHYEVQTKRSVLGSTYWSPSGTSTITTLTVGALVAGASYDARVRAVDKSGNFSTWLTGTFTTNQDGVAPNKPSTPDAVADLGLIFIYWDGKDYLGNAMPSDFKEFRVYFSTTSGFTPSAANYETSMPSAVGGRIPIGDLDYDTTYYFKCSAVDIAGNESAFTTQISGTPVRVTGLDVAALTIETTNLGPGAVTEAKIADLAVTTAKIFNAAIVNAKIADLAVDNAKIANCSIGKLTVGILGADMTVSARIKTNDSGARVELNSAGLKAYNSSNVLTVDISSSTGNITATGTFQTGLSGQRIVIEPTGNGTIYFYPATGTDYAYINAPNQFSVGCNSGTEGTANHTRMWANPSYVELQFLNRTTQAQVGGRIWCDINGVHASGLSGDTFEWTGASTVYMDANPDCTFAMNHATFGTANIFLGTDGGDLWLKAGDTALYESANGVLIRGNASTAFLSLNGSGGGDLELKAPDTGWIEVANGITVKGGNNCYIDYNYAGNSNIKVAADSGNVKIQGGGSGHLVELGSGWGGEDIKSDALDSHETSNAANVNMASGYLRRSTSTRANKVEIDDLVIDPYAVLKLRPVTYYDRRSWEENGNSIDGLSQQVGYIAEEVDEIRELRDTLVEEKFGKPNSLNYERFIAVFDLLIKDIVRRLDLLDARMS